MNDWQERFNALARRTDLVNLSDEDQRELLYTLGGDPENRDEADRLRRIQLDLPPLRHMSDGPLELLRGMLLTALDGLRAGNTPSIYMGR